MGEEKRGRSRKKMGKKWAESRGKRNQEKWLKISDQRGIY